MTRSFWHALLVACALLPQWVVAGPYAYLTHNLGITIFDVSTEETLGDTIARQPPAVAIAARPGVQYAYISEVERVSVLNPSTKLISAVIPFENPGLAIAINPVRPEVYAVRGHCPTRPGSVCTADLSTPIAVIDTTTNSVITTLLEPAGATRVVFNDDGSRAFVSTVGQSGVAIWDTATRTRTGFVATREGAMGMALDPSMRRLYVAENGGTSPGNTVAVIDLSSQSVVARITVGQRPSELVADGLGRLYVSNTDGNSVSAIDMASNSVVATIPVQRPMGIDVAPGGDRVFVASESALRIIDVASLKVGATYALPGGVLSIGRFIGGPPAPDRSSLLTGLWWNPAEPGWGLHVTQRGGTLFAVWFTYGTGGASKWYVASNLGTANGLYCPTCYGQAVWSGDVYQAQGPRFFLDPFRNGSVTLQQAGDMELQFTDRDHGTMKYTRGTLVQRTMPIQRQLFRNSGRTLVDDFSGLWFNPEEPGWGLGITQQYQMMFLTWFVYDNSGQPVWYVASSCPIDRTEPVCRGPLYRTTGPDDPVLAGTFDSSRVRVIEVGTVEVAFSDADGGTLTYTVDGVTQSRNIRRQLF